MKENLMTVKTALAAGGTALGAFLGWKGVMLMAWAAVMALDYLTGTLAACKAGKWSSATAREGLWHKGGMIAVVLVAAITDWVMVVIVEYVPMGLQWPGILLPLVLAWYILTELGSVLENAAALGAKVPTWLIKLLKASADLVEVAGEEANQTGEQE
ncbi:MAG: holin family protein [Faecousia sp.]